jgi:hypothetical protein
LNPIVSGADAYFGGLRRDGLVLYVAQLLSAIVGVMLANLMFSLPPVSISTHLRGGAGR